MTDKLNNILRVYTFYATESSSLRGVRTMKDKSQRKDLSMDNVLEAIIWYYGLDSISLAKGYYFDMDDEARASVLDTYRNHKKAR